MKIKPFFLICFTFIAVMNLSLAAATNLSKSKTVTAWPAIAITPSGKLMVAFSEEVPYSEVFYMISNDGGQSWTSAQNTYSRRAWIKAVDLDADIYGNFHLCYSDGFGSGGREVYYRGYIGGKWQSTEQLSYTNDNSNWCRIGVDRDDIHVAWYQEIGWPAKPIIALKSKKIGGAFPGSWEDVSQNPSNGAMYPDVRGKDGNIYIIYQIQEYSGNNLTGKCIGYNEKISGKWSGPQKLGYYTWPAIDVDDYLNVHCLYPDGNKVIYKAKINGVWQNATQINYRNGVACFFDIKYKKNNLVAAYMAKASRDSKYYSIYYRTKVYNNGWGTWSDEVELEPGIDASLPKIAIDDVGNAHIVWVDKGEGGINDVFYKKVPLFQPDKPYIQLDKSSLSFSTNEGFSPSSQSFQVKNSGTKTLNYTISADKDWLSCTPDYGYSTGEWNKITVNVNSSSLNGGYHYGKITVSSSDAPNSPQEIEVTLMVKPKDPYLELDKDSLSFTGYIGSSNPPAQTFRVRNFGLGAIVYTNTADKFWLSVSPATGTSTGEWDDISVSVDMTGLAEGNYSGNITVTAAGALNSPQNLSVSLKVTRGAPARIKLNKDSLSFKIKKGETTSEPKYFSVKNIGSGTLNYQITANEDWINAFPKTGTSKGEYDQITVTVSGAYLEPGKHTGTISVSASNASNSPQTLKVTAEVESPGIKLSKSYLSFTGIKGDGNPDSKTFSIKNSGSGTLHYELKCSKEWIKYSPKQGTSTKEWDDISVYPSIFSLSKGEYEGIIKIISSDKDVESQEVKISLIVMAPSIELIIPENKNFLSFTTQEGQPAPPAQVFWIKNSTAGTLNCELSTNRDWLKVSPKKEKVVRGKGAETITVSVKSSSLNMGHHEGKITIKAADADNSPMYLTVKLEVTKPPYPYPPLNAQLEKVKHESLFYQVYINTLTWKKNSRNDGHFHITKYRIFRKEKGTSDDYFVLIDEILSNAFEYQDSFSTEEERDRYRYAIVSYDEVQNRESEKAICKINN